MLFFVLNLKEHEMMYNRISYCKNNDWEACKTVDKWIWCVEAKCHKGRKQELLELFNTKIMDHLPLLHSLHEFDICITFYEQHSRSIDSFLL